MHSNHRGLTIFKVPGPQKIIENSATTTQKHDDVEQFNKSDFYSICRIDFFQKQNSSEPNIECPECRMSFSVESQMEAHFLKVHDHV